MTSCSLRLALLQFSDYHLFAHPRCLLQQDVHCIYQWIFLLLANYFCLAWRSHTACLCHWGSLVDRRRHARPCPDCPQRYDFDSLRMAWGYCSDRLLFLGFCTCFAGGGTSFALGCVYSDSRSCRCSPGLCCWIEQPYSYCCSCPPVDSYFS